MTARWIRAATFAAVAAIGAAGGAGVGLGYGYHWRSADDLELGRRLAACESKPAPVCADCPNCAPPVPRPAWIRPRAQPLEVEGPPQRVPLEFECVEVAPDMVCCSRVWTDRQSGIESLVPINCAPRACAGAHRRKAAR